LAELTGVIEDAAEAGRRTNPKRMGELSEAAFLLKAESEGFRVAKPWGDSERYDFIVNAGGRLWRIQLKSTGVLHARGYEVQPLYSVYRRACGRGKAEYTADEIDVLAVHIRPSDVWYVIPVEAVAVARNLRFYPDIACKCARWERYREAWWVMGGE
jgi:PD-(D/E)XK endonuclease